MKPYVSHPFISTISSGCFKFAAVVILVTSATFTIAVRPAQAVPSFARQTGQACASCHTAFPELTPFGRRFKLGGYTMGGGRDTDAYKDVFRSNKWVPPVSLVVAPTFTHTKAPVTDITPGFNANDNAVVQELGLFYAGGITEHVGAFIQANYGGVERNFMWDMVDIRAVNTGSLFGKDVTFGVTANNAPGLQDVWNTVPIWGFPYISTELAPTPAASTMYEGRFGMRVGGLGAYAFFDDRFYLEFTGYKTLPRSTLRSLGVMPMEIDEVGGIKDVAPYARAAWEQSWGNHWLQVGAFGMIANIEPMRMAGSGTDRVSDIGVDSQYQYIGEVHTVSVRGSFIHEDRKSTASQLLGLSDNASNTLDSFRLSASYIYDSTWSFSAGYFNVNGSMDATHYEESANGRPDSSGWIGEIAWLPFSKGGPSMWPWFNVRLGLQYTIYDKFNGARTNYNGEGRDASDNNIVYLYALFAM